MGGPGVFLIGGHPIAVILQAAATLPTTRGGTCCRGACCRGEWCRGWCSTTSITWQWEAWDGKWRPSSSSSWSPTVGGKGGDCSTRYVCVCVVCMHMGHLADIQCFIIVTEDCHQPINTIPVNPIKPPSTPGWMYPTDTRRAGESSMRAPPSKSPPRAVVPPRGGVPLPGPPTHGASVGAPLLSMPLGEGGQGLSRGRVLDTICEPWGI